MKTQGQDSVEMELEKAAEGCICSGAGRSRGRPRTADDAERRSEIVDKALETFMELGYAGTTTEIVTARCRISKATLYRLFSSKTDLFAAVLSAQRQNVLDLPFDRGDLSLAEALRSIFRVDVDPEVYRRNAAFFRLLKLESFQYPELSDLIAQHAVNQSRRLLADFLAEQRAAGEIEMDDPESGARMLMDMMFGAMAQRPGGPEEWPDDKARRAHLERCIDVFLSGVTTPACGRQQ